MSRFLGTDFVLVGVPCKDLNSLEIIGKWSIEEEAFCTEDNM
jgi:hypothetical protein